MDMPSVQPPGAQGAPPGKAPAMGGMLAAVSLPLLLALVLACAYFFFQNASLQSNVSSLNQTLAGLAQKNAEISAQNSQISQSLSASQLALSNATARISDAEGRIASLELTISQKDSAISSLQSELSAEKGKRGQLLQDYQSLQADINSSMAWFSSNAVFPANYSWSSSIMERRLGEDCVDSGKFNLACVSYILENVGFAIHYRTDKESNGKADHLQSLKETINSGWGDCEDYSLLAKSILNLFKQSTPSATLVAWQPGGGQDFRVYPPESKSAVTDSFRYYPDAHGVNVGALGSSFFYVVCYNVDARSGHCAVAVSQAELLSSQDAPNLAGARVFEPQNGRYLGTVGTDLGVCGTGQCLHSPGVIYMVMTDGDLYKQDGNSWAGYADYASKVGALLN